MAKLIEQLSLTSLIILLIGCLVAPGNAMFWLASSLPIYMYLRLCLICLLALLLFVGVPSSLQFRIVLGLSAASLITWATIHTYQETTALLDGLSLLAAGFSMLLMSVEPAKLVSHSVKHGGVAENTKLALSRLKRRAIPYALASILMVGLVTQDQALKNTYRLT